MVRDDKRGHRAWWRTLPGAAALALVVAATLLWASGVANPWVPRAHAQTATPTVTNTPTNTPTLTPTATPNPECDLKVTKSDSPDPVDVDGQITYTIEVKNDADENGVCDGFEVTDVIPDNTECVDIDVVDDDAASVDADTGATDCDDASEGDEVGWDSTADLDDGDSVTLKLVVELTSGADDGDTIENEACATSDDDVGGDCDTERTDVEEGAATSTPVATATTVAGPTATVRPPTVPVVPPVVAPPAPTELVAPLTGSGGSGSGGSLPLTLALGLGGGCLLLLGGVAMLRRPR